jgi:hypothetical protein
MLNFYRSDDLSGHWPSACISASLLSGPGPAFTAIVTGARRPAVLTFPNASSPLGWLYALGSRLTIPVTPRTAAFVRQAIQAAGLAIGELRYAFPSRPRLGHTLVLSAARINERTR